jgi:nucleoside-diphosphate-sugar epimerase
MKLFVTGATGFVGSHFLNQALEAGHEVVALRRPGAQRRIVLGPDPQWLERPMDEIVPADFEGVDVVVHLAAHTANVPYDTLENCLRWNLVAPLRMANAAQTAGVRRFIIAGSCFEYGRAAERYEFIPVDAPLEPTHSYATSKAAASSAFIGFAQEMNLQLSLLRIFQVYGPGEAESRLWSSLKRAAETGMDFPMSAGEQVRDFIFVEEVGRKFMEELDREVQAGVPQIRHIGTGQPTMVRDFAKHWWQHWQAKGQLKIGSEPYRPGEVMRFVPEV